MKRKMVSFILCIAMCMALAIPAFAVELSPYATDEVGNFSQMIEFAFWSRQDLCAKLFAGSG